MIETLSIRNFKVLREVDLRLRPLTLIVGPNASGKSTILDGLRRLWDYLGQGKFTIGDDAREESFLSRNSQGDVYFSVSGELAGKHLEFELSFPQSSREPRKVLGVWDDFEFNERYFFLNRSLSSELQPARALSFNVQRLAAPSYLKDIQSVLPGDGEGLSAFLASLYVESPAQFQEIVRRLRTIIPVVEDIRLRRAYVDDGSHRQVGYELLFDMRGAEGVPASSVSEGTLLTLGLLTALYAAEPPQLVLIDDLERGLHPKALGDLIQQFRLLQEQSPKLQIVATSHSPYLLDYLKAEEVLLTSLDQDGYAAVKSLTEHPEYERWKDLMAPGEFWSTVGESWVTEPVAK